MGVTILVEHRRNEEILEEARVGPIAIVMRREGRNGSGTSREEMEQNASSEQLPKLRWMGSAPG